MGARQYKIMVGDFETTVTGDNNQEETEVWASGLCELYTEDAIIHNNIYDTIDYLVKAKKHFIVYYHNLKFDGAFWLSALMELDYEQAFDGVEFTPKKNMARKTFTYVISDMGQWYSINIVTRYGYHIELRDSLKLIPCSVKAMGEAYKTKHRKTIIEYVGERHAYGEITEQEQEYLKNDLFVVKEVLEIFYNEGHTQLTIGSCCLKEFKDNYNWGEYKLDMPDLYGIELDEEIYGSANADEYIRKSYKGGWCYLKKGCENRVFYNGLTADVNSLYPSRMLKESGCRYPVGKPTFFRNEIPVKLLTTNEHNTYYFVRFRCRFNLKKGKLPCVQIKRNPNYRSNEWLETSDIIYKGKRYKSYIDKDGTEKQAILEMTMTKTDWILFNEHYDITDLEILDGCWFYTISGLFDRYLLKYAEIKQKEKGAKRMIAKLFMNNLYGKMSTSKNSDFKVAYKKENGELGFYTIEANNKTAGFIAIGSAITSYAREFTIRTAQKNYKHFIYADTDSLHMCCKPSDLVDVPVHATRFNHWKLESYWDKAIFVRQKTYIEHVTHEDGEEVSHHFDVKCCGMPQSCKELLVDSLNHMSKEEAESKYEKLWQQDFVSEPRGLEDFKKGLAIYGKLMPKQVKGGIVLVETYFTMN